MSDSDDEIPTLSAATLAALAEFNTEKDERAKKFEDLKASAEADADGLLSMDAFTEDWNISQFWYSDDTAHTLATQLLAGHGAGKTLCVLSAPSAFVALKNILRTIEPSARPKIILLEHDDRFTVFPEFIWYDFQQPFKLPSELKGTVDAIICDPPFLSEDCQTKSAMTARWLLRPKSETHTPRVIVNTGERMKDLILKLFGQYGVKVTTFEPKHANGLSNEFMCYSNVECESWRFAS